MRDTLQELAICLSARLSIDTAEELILVVLVAMLALFAVAGAAWLHRP